MRLTNCFLITAFIISFSGFVNAAENEFTCARNVIVAHRGAWKNNALPENSIAALKYAIDLKCTGSEFDVWMTADDSLIINHDPNYNNLPIEKTNYAALSVFTLLNREKLPTLREYILAGKKNNTATRLVCEIKPSEISPERGKAIAEKVVKLVKKLDASQMIVYISFDYDILKRIVERDPEATTQYLRGDKTPEELKADRITGADYHFSVFKEHPEWIESARKNRIILNVWTVNNIDEMDWFLVNGFDFITTNEPELLFERMKQFPISNDRQLTRSDESNFKSLTDINKF
jgi:glycerophosphoryl diester phosphodiesterase